MIGLWGLEDHIDIPAGHLGILATSSDNFGHFVGVLGIRENPGNGFGVKASNIPDGHLVFEGLVAQIEDLERAIPHGNANFISGVHADPADSFLFKILFTDGFDHIGHIIIEDEFRVRHKHNVVPHISMS